MKTLTICLTLLATTAALADDTKAFEETELFVAGLGTDSLWFDTATSQFNLQRVDLESGLTRTIVTVPVSLKELDGGIDVTVCLPTIGGEKLGVVPTATGHVRAFAKAQGSAPVPVSDPAGYTTGKLSIGIGCGGALGVGASVNFGFEIDFAAITALQTKGE